MKARDIFGLIVRSLGIALVLYGLWYLTFALGEAIGAIPEQTPGQMKFYFGNGIPMVGVGLILLRVARAIVRFSYPRDRDDSDIGPPPLSANLPAVAEHGKKHEPEE